VSRPTRFPPSAFERQAPLAAGFAAFLLSLAALCPDIHVHDSGELVGAGWFLGISHPPGVPLYEILLKIFLTFVPVGSIALRANLFSAAAAGAATFALASLGRGLGATGWVASAAALAWGATATVCSQGAMAEVYTLAALLLFVSLASLARAFETGELRDLERFGFLWGLLLATHMAFSVVTPVLWLVASFVVAGSGEGKGLPQAAKLRRASGAFVRASIAFLVSFSLYLYLPIRARLSPPFDWGDPSTLRRAFLHLTNRANQERMLSLPFEEYVRRGRDYVDILASNLGSVVVPALALGGGLVLLFVPGRSRRSMVAVLLLLWATDAAFVVLLDTAPLGSEAYAIPSLGMIALLLALAGSQVPFGRRLGPAWLVAPLLLAAIGHPAASRSRDFIVRDESDAILGSLPTGTTLFTRADTRTFPIAYRRLVCRDRTDVTLFDRDGNLFARLAPVVAEIPAAERAATLHRKQSVEILRRLELGRPVFSTDADLEDLAEPRIRVEPAGAVHQVFLAGTPRSASLCPLPAGFDFRRGSEQPVDRIDWMCRELLAATREAEGDSRLACGDPEGSKEAWRRAGELSRQAPNHYRLAQRWHRTGDDAAARGELDRALRIDPGFVAAELLGAALDRELGDAASAESRLRRAIARRPDLAIAHENLGVLLASRGDLEGGATELREAARLEPSDGATRFNLALALRRLDRPQEAADALAEALRIDPLNLRWRAALADARSAAKDPEGARRAIEELPPLLQVPVSEDLDRFCASAFRAGAEERCRKLVGQALASDPENATLRAIAAKAGVRGGAPHR
jgi:tetratricopeptide (TPR) repeat protein